MPFGRLQGSNHAHQGIFVALGANKSYGASGPLENLQSAIIRLQSSGISLVGVSRPWQTPAWPDPNDPPFINGCIEISTELEPEALLSRLHQIEEVHGRKRDRRNAPRTLDLDLIDYRGVVIPAYPSVGLELPHPRAAERAFVLLPLRDIAPHWCAPGTGVSLAQLIERLPAEDLNACRPADGVLCAAASGLKRGSA